MSSSARQGLSAPWTTRLPFFYGWVILGVTGLGMFTSGPGQTYTVSVFVNPIIEDLGWSRTSVSGLYTTGSLTAAAAMFLVGRLLDQYGRAGGAAGRSGHLWVRPDIYRPSVSAVAPLRGVRPYPDPGPGISYPDPTTLIAVWFVRLRGRVMALNSLGAVASQAAFPPLIHLLIFSLRLAQRLGRTGVDRLAADANTGDPAGPQKPGVHRAASGWRRRSI